MKKYDLIYYWQNYLINQENMEFKPDAYVLKVSLVNSYSRDYFCNWYSFKCIQELISFIKYVLIPSTYITKVFGKEEDTIFLDALDYYDTIELMQDSENIDKFVEAKNIENVEEITSFKSATIIGNLTKEDKKLAEDLGLKFSKVELQKLFIYLTEKEEV